MALDLNKQPDIWAKVKLTSLYEEVFKDIADIDEAVLDENLNLGCTLPEELRTLKESRFRYITVNFSKFMIALMKTEELRKSFLDAIENEKQLLDSYLSGSTDEYEAGRTATAAELPWEFSGTETITVDLIDLDEDIWDSIVSEINNSYDSLDDYGKDLYEKTKLAFTEDPSRISELGYIAGNFMLALTAMSQNDKFYMEIVHIMSFVNKVMAECWTDVAQQLEWPEYEDYFDDEPEWPDEEG